MSTASILDRFLDPFVDFLPAETARKIVDLPIDPEMQTRLDVIAIFKLKARAALRRQGS